MNKMNMRLFSRLIGAITTIAIIAQASGQTFVGGSLGQGDGSSRVYCDVAQAPDGKYYALWRDGNFRDDVMPVMPRYQLMRYEPGTMSWTAVDTILATDVPDAFVNDPSMAIQMLSTDVGLEIDGAGNFHIVLQMQLNSGATVVYGFSADGTTWSFTNIDSNNNVTNFSLSDADLRLDSTGKPHIVNRQSEAHQSPELRPTRIRYHSYNGSVWTHETALERIGSKFAINSDVAFDLDSSGKAHVAFEMEVNGSGTDGGLHYISNTSGSWGSPHAIALGATSFAVALEVDLVVDQNDHVHVVRRNKD